MLTKPFRKHKHAEAHKSKVEVKDKSHRPSAGVATALLPPNPNSEPLEKHPIEAFVADLLDPTLSDAKREEYEWYAFYQTSELISSADTVEPQDLDLYYKAAQIAQGNIPEQRESDQAAYERYVYGLLGEGTENAGDKRYTTKDCVADTASQHHS